MEFQILSREEIEVGIVVCTPYVVISISDPGTRRPKILRPAGFRDALYLKFHDAVPVESPPLPARIKPMRLRHAEQIWDFVCRYRDQVGTVVVHCEQGMSRSPAVAAALCRQFNGDDRHFFQQYQPNEYVYALMLSALPCAPGP